MKLPNGKIIKTIILKEPDDLSEAVVKEEKEKVNSETENAEDSDDEFNPTLAAMESEI